MNKNITTSFIIGIFLGASYTLAEKLDPTYAIMTVLGTSLASGALTVALIKKRSNLYCMVSVLVAMPFLLAAYGVTDGFIYSVGLAFIYGVFMVQLFQAISSVCIDVTYISKKITTKIKKSITRDSK
ncbi:hypothetical protein ACWJJH_02625 [Endozoicomonadaceae bacterium StTr2]